MANIKYTKEFLEEKVKECTSIRQLIISLGLKETGGNYSNLKSRLKQFKVDISHFTGQVWNKGKEFKTGGIDKWLVENSQYESGRKYNTYKLRNRLIIEGYKEAKCEICNNTDWNNLPIALEVHHINGTSNDNRLENLQILCPNCHAQTDNYRGKNIKKK